MSKHNYRNRSWRSRRSGTRSLTRASVMLETAFVFLLVILPMTFAIVQFGIFYATTNALTQLTRDSARFAAVYCIANSNNPNIPGDETKDQFIIDHIKEKAKNSLLYNFDPASIIISPARGDRRQYGSVSVSISYDLNKKSFTPFQGRIFKPGVTQRTSTAMVE